MVLLNGLILYSGASGFIFLLVAFYTGVTEADFRLHKASAMIGVSFMVLHGLLVWLRGWKVRKLSRVRAASADVKRAEETK